MLGQEEPAEPKLHEWNIIPKNKGLPCKLERYVSERRQKNKKLSPITWTVSDISKAGCLLKTPPLTVSFEDEQEMRRVYTLIYDVFRYKNVLMEALNDALFFQTFPKLEETIPHVWLLFYDLYHRSFKKRETSVAPLAGKLFDAAGLSFAENALWTQKVRLAASVSRLRIKYNALTLNELLPSHLKDEKVTEHSKNNPVTCWVNCMKVSNISELIEDVEKTLKLKIVTNMEDLVKNTFKWDRHCPQIMTFHSSMRESLARSKFLKSHLLIAQDKSFCRGAATFGKILFEMELTGSVIQTHVNSPRTTAYLATLLTHNNKIKKLMAFSAGKRKPEYECYFTELGVKNITIFSDRLIDLPPDATYMEEVVAVFATPPNSYSAVTDPIDLVCSRGGDLSMLEILTESEETKDAKERVISILEEQRRTLRFAMSRPQIQFVLYETHSELEKENEDMVNNTLRDVNKLAKLQHATLQGKFCLSDFQADETISMEIKEINNNEKTISESGDKPNQTKRTSIDSVASKLTVDFKERLLDNLQIPDTDIFINPDLPSLCPNENSCINVKKEGCYLALIQRKEIVRLDDKYMIQMAENRGLFGSNTTTTTTKSKTSRTSKKKPTKADRKPKHRKKLLDAEKIDAFAQIDELSEMDDSVESIEIPRITNYDGGRPISKSILNRLTSANLRQFVSPDYKQDATFSVPSQSFGFLRATYQAKVLNVAKLKEKQPPPTINSVQPLRKVEEIKKPKETSKESVTSSTKSRKKKKKSKIVLDRLRLPTLSFMLKANNKEENQSEADSDSVLKHTLSPCERFNRRNPSQQNNQK
ncbi:uncharacterized protein LOC115887256 [Sitophilus oryzae]|uniref:Uncharacterized protein LOC115887256 n=1 Tax=Sitophilus oryzae TaxID=7048 RepID=A0A6J2YGE1_SITOR|nr:uncharacterized protein LOC115887256 [Sitophilus oryzae]